MNASSLVYRLPLLSFHLIGRLCLYVFILFCCSIGSFAQTSENTIAQIERINQTFARISEKNAYVESLDYNDLPMVHLPIGMKRTISGIEITIAVNRFALGPAYSELGVYAKAVIPQGSDGHRLVLFFGAEGLKGTHSGGYQVVASPRYRDPVQ